MTRERDEIVKTIVRETLAERFTDDEFVFDPIQVVPVVNEFGDGDGAIGFGDFLIFSSAFGNEGS